MTEATRSLANDWWFDTKPDMPEKRKACIKKLKDGPPVNSKRHWRVMVDDRTGLKFSKFFESKNGMVEPTLEQWMRWHHAGTKVNRVRMDNAGENKRLEARANSADWKELVVSFEYTPRDTPQHNHLAE